MSSLERALGRLHRRPESLVEADESCLAPVVVVESIGTPSSSFAVSREDEKGVVVHGE
jgi:hypothetical protein